MEDGYDQKRALETATARISDEILERVSLEGGKLHVSGDALGNPGLLWLAARLKSCGLATSFVSHPTADFAARYKARTLRRKESGSKIEGELSGLIKTAFERGASDIHVLDMGDYGLIRLRIHGELVLHAQTGSSYAASLIAVAFNAMGEQTEQSGYSASVQIDGRIASRKNLPPGLNCVRLHAEPVATASGRAGSFLSMRLLHDTTGAQGTLEERLATLGYRGEGDALILPKALAGRRWQSQREDLRALCARDGLALVAGPTGHGKSTLLRHVMESMVAEAPQKSFFSVEDPPEYPLLGVGQIQVATAVEGAKDASLARARNYVRAIAGAMRSDPDVIMIGEIRYPEAAAAAVDAARTGHAVWTSIHASDAFGIVGRLASLLSSSAGKNAGGTALDSDVLSGFCCQRLVPLLCPDCKRPLLSLDRKEQSFLRASGLWDRLFKLLPSPESVFVRAKGRTPCPTCGGSGLSGRSAAAETVVLDGALRGFISRGDLQGARRLWADRGGRSIVESAAELVAEGLADPILAESALGRPLAL